MAQNQSSKPVLTSPEAVDAAAVADAQSYLEAQAKVMAELKAQIEALRADNATLAAKAAAKANGSITLKLTDKGGISAYGFGRFPVTLYPGAWERLMSPEFQTKLAEFFKANATQIAAAKARHAAAKALASVQK